MTFHPAVVVSNLGGRESDRIMHASPHMQVIVLPAGESSGRLTKAINVDVAEGLLAAIADPDLAESVRLVSELFKKYIERTSAKECESICDLGSEKELLLREEQMHEILKQVLTEQEKENFRVGAVLHDDVGQSLAALKLGIGLLKHELPVGYGNQINEFIDIIESISTRIRRLSRELAPYNQYSTLSDSIRRMFADVESSGLLKITADLRALEFSLGGTWNTDYFRIVQQLISCIVSQGDATEIVLETRTESDQLILETCDNGISIFNSPKLHGTGFGFFAVQRRIAALRGNYKATEIKNEHGKTSGTRNEIRIPIEVIQNISG